MAPLHPWHDTSLSPRARAELLRDRLTLEEKAAQLTGHWEGFSTARDDDQPAAPGADRMMSAAPLAQAAAHGLGHLTRPFGTAPIEPRDGMRRLQELQRTVRAQSRFAIPALAHEEALTGMTTFRATVFPTPLALAATFDPDLVRAVSGDIGALLAGLGVHQALCPVLDVVHDYRWGRVEETFGEDPFLVGEMGVAYVSGIEEHGVIATLKHFAAYSASRGGLNHGPVSMGARELTDTILPPFHRAIAVGGARSVMASYSAIDGVPGHADTRLLDHLLRGVWGFDGVVVSDYWGVQFLEMTQAVAADDGEAAALALTAGVDVELPNARSYLALADEVGQGRIDGALIDRAVLRVLTQKAEQGLLDADWEPAEPREIDLDPAPSRALALRAAEESIVLLKNDGALPLRAPAGVAVVGPLADHTRGLFGCYSYPSHVLPNHPGLGDGVDAATLFQALRDRLPDTAVRTSEGCHVLDEDDTGLADAVARAKEAAVAIVVVGDWPGLFGHGTSGEGCDVSHLRLPGGQERLVREVAATGTPTVLVVLSGRPYAIGGLAEHCAAVVQAFLPGEEGGSALARVLCGDTAPSGRLPVQIPAEDAAHPGTYLRPILGSERSFATPLTARAAFPFGYGLGYVQPEVASAGVRSATSPTTGGFTVRVDVGNPGDAPAVAVPQVYAARRDLGVVQPLHRLVGFARVTLAPGERRRVEIEVPAARLAAADDETLVPAVRPGDVVLEVGTSERDILDRIEVTLTGDVVRGWDAS